MEFEDQNSAFKSVRGIEEMQGFGNQSNGSSNSHVGICFSSSSKIDDDDDVKGKGVETGAKSTKGFGLKKWRRIRRELRNDGDGIVDSEKFLKRGLSNVVANSVKIGSFPAGGGAQVSGGSVSSTNAVFRSGVGVLVDGFGVMGPNFDAGAESENSEDRSSKSSTAASGPRTRYEAAKVVVMGNASDNHGLRSGGGRNLGASAQQGKGGRAETSKKARGERVKIEKENSHSSVESDSRSSNLLFMQGGGYYATSNGGTKGDRPMSYDGEFSDDAQDRDRPRGEELHAGPDRGNDRLSENVSQEDLAAESPWEVKEEKSENQGFSTDHDQLMESIIGLQAAQEALERELHKFKEIGKDVIFGHSLEDVGLPSDVTYDDSGLPRASTSEQSLHGNSVQRSVNFQESEVVSLKENVILLGNELQKAADLVKSKDARITELEAILGSSSINEEKTIDSELHQSTKDTSELEGLFRQKIEAEIQYLAISTTVQKLRGAAVDEITILEEQKLLAAEQVEMVHRLEDAEAKAAALKTRAEKVESYCEDIATMDEKLALQKNIYKYSSCFLIQLLVLLAVLVVVLKQMSPYEPEVVPT